MKPSRENQGRSAPKDCPPDLIETVLGAAIRVHSALGPGLLESVYENALMVELTHLEIGARQQAPISVEYRGEDLGIGFRADILVEDVLLLELKSVNSLDETHLAQVLTYLKLLNLKRGFLINFNERMLRDGIRRVSI